MPYRLDPSVGAFRGLGLFIALLVAGFATETLGQRASTSRRSTAAERPSLSGPSQSFTRDFGQIARTLSDDSTSGYSRSSRRANDSSMFGNLARRRNLGRSRRATGQRLEGQSASLWGSSSTGGLLATRRSLLRPSEATMGDRWQGVPYRPPGGWGRYSALQQIMWQQEQEGPLGLGPSRLNRLTENDYVGWIQPDVVINDMVPRTPIAGGDDVLPAPEDRQTVADLAVTYVETRRQNYMDLGWQRFKQGNYRGAFHAFELADAVSLGRTAGDEEAIVARASVKFAIVRAAVACQQYAQAMNALRWLLTRDSLTGKLPDPEFLTRIEDVAGLYPSDGAYSQQVRAVGQLVVQNPRAVEAQALNAVTLYGNTGNAGARENAIFYARTIASNPEVGEPWSNLYQVMLSASTDRGHEPTGAQAMAGPTDATLLPWELPEEGMPAEPR